MQLFTNERDPVVQLSDGSVWHYDFADKGIGWFKTSENILASTESAMDITGQSLWRLGPNALAQYEFWLWRDA